MFRQSLLIALLLSLRSTPPGVAELQPSDGSQQTQCKFQDRTDVTIEYGMMRLNGRKIFGELVPYGETWEMGKRSPSFVTNTNVVVGGKEVPAGNYSLVTLPASDKWTLVVKKMPSRESRGEKDEIARIDLTIRHLPTPLENFTISFDQVRGGCVLSLRWEQTEASVLLAEKK